MQQIRTRVEQGLDMAIVAAGSALNHVAGQGVRAAGKADQWHAIAERTPHLGNRIGHITQAIVGVWYGQPQNVPLFTQGAFKTRPFTLAKIQPQPHGIGHRQNVGENDGGVQIVARQRLQRHLTGERRVPAQVEKAAGAPAQRAVFRQITPGLTHHPDRRMVGRLAQQRAQKIVVTGSSHGDFDCSMGISGQKRIMR